MVLRGVYFADVQMRRLKHKVSQCAQGDLVSGADSVPHRSVLLQSFAGFLELDIQSESVSVIQGSSPVTDMS